MLPDGTVITVRQWFRLQRAAMWATGDRQAHELHQLGLAVADQDPIAVAIVAWFVNRTPFRYADLHRSTTAVMWARDITR